MRRADGRLKCAMGDCPKQGRSVQNPYCKAHGGGRRCQEEGCLKAAEGDTDRCKAHGGGKRCQEEGCPKAAQGATHHCIAHGGGRRCQEEGCLKAARGGTQRCKAHGGGRRCQHLGCPKAAADGAPQRCAAHGGGKRCQNQGCGTAVAKEPRSTLCKLCLWVKPYRPRRPACASARRCGGWRRAPRGPRARCRSAAHPVAGGVACGRRRRERCHAPTATLPRRPAPRA
jgi:hypothetical protein